MFFFAMCVFRSLVLCFYVFGLTSVGIPEKTPRLWHALVGRAVSYAALGRDVCRALLYVGRC